VAWQQRSRLQGPRARLREAGVPGEHGVVRMHAWAAHFGEQPASIARAA
jgi:hypothetical protein